MLQFPIMSKEIHPDVQATMDMWDRITGRSSRGNGRGPQSEETRKRLSDALNKGVAASVIKSPDGEPMPEALRHKIGEARTASNKKRRNNS